MAIAKDKAILIYQGKQLTQATYDKCRNTEYVLKIGPDQYVDAKPPRAARSLGGYVNHSCDPNSKLVICDNNLDSFALFVALRDIEPGEEVTFDYGEDYYGHFDTCLCGTNKCKKGRNPIRK